MRCLRLRIAAMYSAVLQSTPIARKSLRIQAHLRSRLSGFEQRRANAKTGGAGLQPGCHVVGRNAADRVDAGALGQYGQQGFDDGGGGEFGGENFQAVGAVFQCRKGFGWRWAR